MSRFVPLATIVLLAGACVPGGGATEIDAVPVTAGRVEPGRSTEVRVATFNAEFLFDGAEPEGGADFPWRGDPAAARTHRRAVSRIVRSLNADLVVLVEVENVGVLDSMAGRDLADMGYSTYLIEGRDSFTGQDVGLLSRLPIERAFRTNERAPAGVDGATYGVAKNLIARLTIDGLPVTLIGAHLLAQARNPERRPLREAQAEVIRRQVVRESAAGRHVIVAGDLNDYDALVPDAGDSRPVAATLATIRRAGPGSTDDLFNAMALVPQQRRHTVGRDADGDGRLERHEVAAVDHILLSPGLRGRLVATHVAHSPEARAASDHLPLVITLRTGGPRTGGSHQVPGP